MGNWKNDKATEKQIKFLQDVMQKKYAGLPDFDPATMTKGEASEIISRHGEGAYRTKEDQKKYDAILSDVPNAIDKVRNNPDAKKQLEDNIRILQKQIRELEVDRAYVATERPEGMSSSARCEKLRSRITEKEALMDAGREILKQHFKIEV